VRCLSRFDSRIMVGTFGGGRVKGIALFSREKWRLSSRSYLSVDVSSHCSYTPLMFTRGSWSPRSEHDRGHMLSVNTRKKVHVSCGRRGRLSLHGLTSLVGWKDETFCTDTRSEDSNWFSRGISSIPKAMLPHPSSLGKTPQTSLTLNRAQAPLESLTPLTITPKCRAFRKLC
jgi:hypothetical protein